MTDPKDKMSLRDAVRQARGGDAPIKMARGGTQPGTPWPSDSTDPKDAARRVVEEIIARWLPYEYWSLVPQRSRERPDGMRDELAALLTASAERERALRLGAEEIAEAGLANLHRRDAELAALEAQLAEARDDLLTEIQTCKSHHAERDALAGQVERLRKAIMGPCEACGILMDTCGRCHDLQDAYRAATEKEPGDGK